MFYNRNLVLIRGKGGSAIHLSKRGGANVIISGERIDFETLLFHVSGCFEGLKAIRFNYACFSCRGDPQNREYGEAIGDAANSSSNRAVGCEIVGFFSVKRLTLLNFPPPPGD